jgi:hypothetical protein
VAPVTVEAAQLDSVIVPSPTVVAGEPGAVGLLNGVTAFEAIELSEVNVEFLAVTVNVRDVVDDRLLRVKDVLSVTSTWFTSSLLVHVVIQVT